MENQNYIGCIPEMEYYQPEFFHSKVKKDFEKWYSLECKKTFDFSKELVDYCISDVKLLTEGCLKFRFLCIENTKLSEYDTGVDPLKTNLTIASFCNYTYRRNFMPKNCISIIPDNGLNPKQQSSFKCKLWLSFIAFKNKNIIQQADQRGGEKKIGPYFCDGFDLVNKKIYEFHGCYW